MTPPKLDGMDPVTQHAPGNATTTPDQPLRAATTERDDTDHHMPRGFRSLTRQQEVATLPVDRHRGGW
jgi:hypothetical protein